LEIIAVRGDRDIEHEKAGILRREIDLAVAQAERGEFSSCGVMEIAARVLHEAMEPKRRLIRALRDQDDDRPTPPPEPSTRKAPENPSQAARASTDGGAAPRRKR
jgi:hypothetical protein